MTDLIGQTIGQYVVLEEIGRGGMATVYRAFQLKIGRDVAIKVLPAAFTHDQTFLARFSREVELAARLQHTRILPVYDYGEYEGQPYIVSAYMPGGNLEQRIAEGTLPLDEVVRLVGQIAEGLDYLHGEGVIHRDFKPSNVLLDAAGSAFLSDFGIARVQEATAQLTGTGMIGTPAYMAPELFSTGDATPASDIYALGVTLYAILSGAQPFDAETPAQHMRAHLEKPVPDIRRIRPDLPPGVQMVIATALAKDPARRYASAGEMAAALKAAAYPAPVRAAAKKPRSIPVWPLAAMGGIVALGIIAVGAFFALRGSESAQTGPTDLTPQPPLQAGEGETTTAVTATLPPTMDVPAPTAMPTEPPPPIPVVGGGTGVMGFNMNGLGYTIDVSCVVAGGQGCDLNPHILPQVNGITPTFGQWSPDNTRIAFEIRSNEPQDVRIDAQGYVFDLASTYLIQIENGNSYNLVWSPDSKRTAYLSGGDIYLTDLSCTEQTGENSCISAGRRIFDYPLAHALSSQLIFAWLPDDRLVINNPDVLISNPAPGRFTIDLNGQNLERSGRLPGARGPEGLHAITYEYSEGEIIVRATEIATQHTWPVMRLDTADRGGAATPAVSPDGNYLAYIQTTDRFDPGEIIVVDLRPCIGAGYMGCQGTGVQLTDDAVGEGYLSFSPDGQWLAFVRAARSEIGEGVEQQAWDCGGPNGCVDLGDIPGQFLFNRDGDIYVMNLAQALDGAGESAVIRLTYLQFITYSLWSYGGDLTPIALYWQPVAR